jgi:hypothetical protein
MAIDDEIDAAQSQIEFGKTSIAPKVVIHALEALAAVGVPATKPAAYFMKKVFEQREENTAYLLDATISRLRGLEEQVKTLSDAHKQFIAEQLPLLLADAVSKSERMGSKERIDRLSLIVVHTVMEGPTADLEGADEMMRVTVDLTDADIAVLAKIYAVQGAELKRTNFLPETNLANTTWRDLQSEFPIFKSSEIHSVCAKLQSLGLVTQVSPIGTILDLTSIPYVVLRKGADYLKAVGKLPETGY